MRTITGLATAMAILARAGASHAGLVFDDFGAGGAFDPVNGYVASGGHNGVPALAVAAHFTAAASGHLATVRLALAYLSGPNDFAVSLLADDGDTPGVVLESFALAEVPTYGGAYTPEALSSSLHAALVAGTKYWLEVAAAPGTLGTRNFNVVGASGPVFQTGAGVQPTTLPAFAVGVAVPEPPSLALCGVALAPLAAATRRGLDPSRSVSVPRTAWAAPRRDAALTGAGDGPGPALGTSAGRRWQASSASGD